MKDFFLSISEELERKEGNRLGVIWRKQANGALLHAPIKKEHKEEFSELGTYLAEADTQVRKNAMEFYFARLDEEIAALRASEKDKAYLYRTMGMLGGLFLLLIAA